MPTEKETQKETENAFSLSISISKYILQNKERKFQLNYLFHF